MGAVGILILVWVLLLLTAGCAATRPKGYYEMRRERERFFDGAVRERIGERKAEVAEVRREIRCSVVEGW
jgi:hypothetical protein